MSEFRTGGGALKRAETDAEPSIAVVEAVADAEGVDPLELPPLYTAVDPDALDDLFAAAPGRSGATGGGEVTFDYCGRRVTVAADGGVSLSRR